MTMPADQHAAFRQSLLTSPGERQDVEYKSSQPFQDGTDFGLKLVKHILGMANTGGGWIVIGYEDGTLRPDPNHTPVIAATYDSTKLTDVVDRYISAGQNIRLAVYMETHPATGVNYPIIEIASLDRTPFVCRSTKSASDTNAMILQSGKVYIRRPGAATSEIQTAAEWDELLKRCVAQRRDEFVGEFADLVRRMTAGDTTPRQDARTMIENFMSSRRKGSTIHQSLSNGQGYMEFAHMLIHVQAYGWKNNDLLKAVNDSAVDWPRFDSTTPRMTGIDFEAFPANFPTLAGNWCLEKTGTYYRSRLLVEDYEPPSFESSLGHPDKSLWYDLSVVRIAQALKSSAALYAALQVAPNEPYLFSIRHEGLQGRTLYASNPWSPWYTAYRKVCHEEMHQWQKEITRDLVEGQLAELTHEIASSLFELFEFAGVSIGMVQRLIEEYVLRGY